MDLKTRIHQARKQAKLSQQSLGDIIGVSDKAVSAYEVGRSIPPLKVLQKISEATEQPLSFFLQNAQDEASTTDLILNKLTQVEKELKALREQLETTHE